jgi:hypothetical protein
LAFELSPLTTVALLSCKSFLVFHDRKLGDKNADLLRTRIYNRSILTATGMYSALKGAVPSMANPFIPTIRCHYQSFFDSYERPRSCMMRQSNPFFQCSIIPHGPEPLSSELYANISQQEEKTPACWMQERLPEGLGEVNQLFDFVQNNGEADGILICKGYRAFAKKRNSSARFLVFGCLKR